MSDRLLDGELHTTLPLAASSGSWPATRDVATSPTRRLAIDSGQAKKGPFVHLSRRAQVLP